MIRRGVDKYLAPKLKYIDTLKPVSNKFSVLTVQSCKSFGLVNYLIFKAKQGFVLGKKVKGYFLGAVKLHFLSSDSSFSLKLCGRVF